MGCLMGGEWSSILPAGRFMAWVRLPAFLRALPTLTVQQRLQLRFRQPFTQAFLTPSSRLHRHGPAENAVNIFFFFLEETHQIFGRNRSLSSPEAWFQGWKPPAPQEASDARMPRGKEGGGKAPGMAYSRSQAHLQGHNLMDVVDSAFSIHNLYAILSGKVQLHNECMS